MEAGDWSRVLLFDITTGKMMGFDRSTGRATWADKISASLLLSSQVF
jgi:hypothetical protein